VSVNSGLCWIDHDPSVGWQNQRLSIAKQSVAASISECCYSTGIRSWNNQSIVDWRWNSRSRLQSLQMPLFYEGHAKAHAPECNSYESMVRVRESSPLTIQSSWSHWSLLVMTNPDSVLTTLDCGSLRVMNENELNSISWRKKNVDNRKDGGRPSQKRTKLCTFRIW